MVLGQDVLEAEQKFRQNKLLLADDLWVNLDSDTAVLAFSSITLI